MYTKADLDELANVEMSYDMGSALVAKLFPGKDAQHAANPLSVIAMLDAAITLMLANGLSVDDAANTLAEFVQRIPRAHATVDASRKHAEIVIAKMMENRKRIGSEVPAPPLPVPEDKQQIETPPSVNALGFNDILWPAKES